MKAEETVTQQWSAADKVLKDKKKKLDMLKQQASDIEAELTERHAGDQGMISGFLQFFENVDSADQRAIRGLLLKLVNTRKVKTELEEAERDCETLRPALDAAREASSVAKKNFELFQNEVKMLKEIETQLRFASQYKKAPFGTCCICYERPATHVGASCGHVSMCGTCSGQIMAGSAEQQRCPFCRENFGGVFPKQIFCPTL